MFKRVKKEFSNILGFFTKEEEEDLDNLLSDFEEESLFDCFMESLQLSNELFTNEHKSLVKDGGSTRYHPYIEMSKNGQLLINKLDGRISLERSENPYEWIDKNYQYHTISYWRNKMTFTPIHPNTIKPCIVVDPITHPKFQEYKSQEKIKNILKNFNNLNDINSLENSLIKLNQESLLDIRDEHRRYEAVGNGYNYWSSFGGDELFCSGDNYGISFCKIILSNGKEMSLNEYRYLQNHPEMWSFI